MNLLMVEIAKWPQCAGTRLPKCSHIPGFVASLAYPVPPPHGANYWKVLWEGEQHPFDQSGQFERMAWRAHHCEHHWGLRCWARSSQLAQRVIWRRDCVH